MESVRQETDLRPRVSLDSLTSLRALAAFAVLSLHVSFLWNHGHLRFLNNFSDQGYVGVSLFFILSGFVLTFARDAAIRHSVFWRRRAARIVPAYWLAIVLAMFVSWYEVGSVRALGATLFTFTLLQSWIPNPHWWSAGNFVGWSLSDEVFFYVAFPFVAGPIAALTLRGRKTLLVGLFAYCIVVPLLARPSTAQFASQEGWRFWLVYVSPLTRLAEFLIGIVMANLFVAGHRVPVRPLPAVVLAVIAYVIAGLVPAYLSVVAITVVPFSLLIFACAQSDQENRRSPLRVAWLVRLGAWSYAFYLIHSLVMRVAAVYAAHHQPSQIERAIYFVVLISVTWAASAFIYKFVEMPLERRFRGSKLPKDRGLNAKA